MRDIDTIDSDLRLVAALRGAAWERGGPLPSIAVADALVDERYELTQGCLPAIFTISGVTNPAPTYAAPVSRTVPSDD